MTTLALVSVSFAVLSFVGPGAADEESSPECRATAAVRLEPPPDPNADPFGSGPWYVNGDRTIWAGGDAVRMRAGKNGNKVLWIRPAGTQLTVSGRRLDASAPPMKPTIPCCYPTGFQASGIAFPTEGCWEIVASAGTSQLTFVTKVAPDGAPVWGAETSEDLAQKAADSWLKLVDGEKYAGSWTEAAKLFKGAVTKEQWQHAASGVRRPLGKLVSRKVKSRQLAEKLPGAPDGKYVIIQYDTVFSGKSSAVETVTPMLDPDGTWRVSGYFIK